MSRLTFLRDTYKQPKSIFISFFGIGFMSILFYYFSDFELIKGNMGVTYSVLNSTLQYLISIIFGINLALIFYRQTIFSKQGASTTIGGFFGAIVAGCPACGITLASALGFGSLFSTLPFAGLELKGLGILLLSYAFFTLTSEKCKFKPSKQ